MIKGKSGFLAAGFCIAVFIIAVSLGNGAADGGYFGPAYSKAPQNAQEREGLFKAIQNEEKNVSQVTLSGAYPYQALQNPYALTDPQAALELASASRSIQKLDKLYQNPSGVDNWYYWSNMWLNGPQETANIIKGPGNSFGVAETYGAMDNPYGYIDPQAALEQANTYQLLQKQNSIYQNPTTADNWYYWSNLWLNGA